MAMMTPKRLLAFLTVFLVVAAAYFLLDWRDRQKEQAEQAAKRLYQVKETEISSLTLKKGPQVIRLEKKDGTWRLTEPVHDTADKEVVQSVLTTLAYLTRNRELGEEKDFQPFGLDNPGLIVRFTVPGHEHQVLVGAPTPGRQGYYVLKDQNKNVMIISAADKESLDRPLTAWRDKTLLAFTPDKVKALKIRVDAHHVDLQKTSPDAWTWLGKEQIRVRADRVDSLLRRLDLARIKDFIIEFPGAKDLASCGLAPRPKGEIILEEGEHKAALLLGDTQKDAIYARRGSGGPIFLVEERLKKDIGQALSGLEDRRLWTGALSEVHKLSWGTPAKTWTAIKEEKSWRLTGPTNETLSQTPLRVEMALQRFQDLEDLRRWPEAKPAEPQGFVFELQNAADQLLVRLVETAGPDADKVEVSLEQPGKMERALISRKTYQGFKEDLDRLTQKPLKEN
jgi:hypothetical protein